MGFNFRLEKVLSLRLREREQAQLKNSAAKKNLEIARTRLMNLHLDLKASHEFLEKIKREDKLDETVLQCHTMHCHGLKSDICRVEIEVQKADVMAKATADALLQAHRATEVLEKLRENELNAWKKEQLKKEALMVDEIAVSRFRLKEDNNGT